VHFLLSGQSPLDLNDENCASIMSLSDWLNGIIPKRTSKNLKKMPMQFQSNAARLINGLFLLISLPFAIRMMGIKLMAKAINASRELAHL
jgi:hypothetical protein